jgi:regulator of protease activity HflC (stomatin/prohibitin superfamily)
MFKITSAGIGLVTLIAGGVWGWVGAIITIVALLAIGGALLLRREGEVVVPELSIGVVFRKKGDQFVRFLEPGTHWINPAKEQVSAYISTSGQSASAQTKGVQAIGGLPLEIDWTVVYSLKPQKLSTAARPKMARALPHKAAAIARQQINNCWHHLIGDYTIEQLTELGAHKKLERQMRQLAKVRLEPLGFEINRIMIDAIHMPKQVMQALEAAHEREMQAEKEARALEKLQKVVSQFSENDMARLMELERLHVMGKQGFTMVYPNGFPNGYPGEQLVTPFDGRRMNQTVNVTPKMAT